MKLLAHVHMSAPVHGAGAEWMLDAVLSWLVRNAGMDVRMVARDLEAPWLRDGYVAEPVPPHEDLMAMYADADVILTHLDVTPQAMGIAAGHRKPVAHLVHNDQQLAFHRVPEGQLAIWNSWWLRSASKHQTGVVCHPPVWADHYPFRPGPHDAVALLNVSKAKGSDTFYGLAERWPTQRFLGVCGAYNAQDVRPLPNVEHLPHQNQIQRVYAQTQVLVMPSAYESFGRAALEAACAGIPTISTPTLGLVECMGDAGVYVPARDADGWDEALDCVLDNYDCQAAAVKARADGWQDAFRRELEGLAHALWRYSEQPPVNARAPEAARYSPHAR